MEKLINGPKGLPFIGMAKALKKDPIGLFESCAREYGEIVRLPLFHRNAFLLSSPELIQQAFIVNQKKIQREDMFSKIAKVMGNGLLTNDGADWKKNRVLIQTVFRQKNMNHFIGIMREESEKMIRNWQNKISTSNHSNQPLTLPMGEEMMTLTLNIVFRCLLSIPYDSPEKRQAFLELNRIVGKRLWSFLPGSEYLPSVDNINFQIYNFQLRSLVQSKIKERLETKEDIQDFLGMLIAARAPEEEGGKGLSKQQIADEVLTFAFAGHETTAIALTWVFEFLEQRPDLIESMRQEATEFLAKDQMDMSDFEAMVVTKAVFLETLRLRPPAWFIPRTVQEKMELGQYEINKGSILFISPYVMHHLSKYWDEPLRFKPERFFDAKSALSEKRNIYIPFNIGPHTCIGAQFAIFEAILALAHVVKHFNVQKIGNSPTRLEPAVTLRQGNSLQVAVEPRQAEFKVAS